MAVELDGGGRRWRLGWQEPPEPKEDGGAGAREKTVISGPFGWWAGGDFLQAMTLDFIAFSDIEPRRLLGSHRIHEFFLTRYHFPF